MQNTNWGVEDISISLPGNVDMVRNLNMQEGILAGEAQAELADD